MMVKYPRPALLGFCRTHRQGYSCKTLNLAPQTCPLGLSQIISNPTHATPCNLDWISGKNIRNEPSQLTHCRAQTSSSWKWWLESSTSSAAGVTTGHRPVIPAQSDWWTPTTSNTTEQQPNGSPGAQPSCLSRSCGHTGV